MSVVAPLEEVRKRIRESVERIRARVPILGEGGILSGKSGLLRGQKEPLIGGGKLITTAEETLKKISEKALELRPKIIPTVMEKIKTFEPGRRITEFIPAPTGGETPKETGEKSRLLRK